MTDVAILITMDVEPVKWAENWGGPTDVDASERYITAFWKFARERGYPATFFIHPEIAMVHRMLFREMDDDGACMGLHIHASKFQHPLWEYEFGYYSAEEQAQMLRDGKEQWAMALEYDPVYFRPGAFSANDETFPTLVETGFIGGSVSMPGRVWPESYCVWAGAEPDPHRAHRQFRHVPGDLKFANVPITVDFKSPRRWRHVRYFQDLRPTRSTRRGRPVSQVLRNVIARIAKVKPAVPVIQITAHNGQTFDDPYSSPRRWLEDLLAEIPAACEEKGLRAVPATFDTVCARVLDLPPWKAPRWEEEHEIDE